MDDGGARSARRPRRRARALAAALAVAGAALAAAGDRYPTSEDADVIALEAAWAAQVVEPSVAMCTGDVAFARTEETRDPDGTTGALAVWTPLRDHPTGGGTRCVRTGGVTSLRHDGGGDLEVSGQDGYFMYRFTAVGANLFLRLILEAEDGASETWRIRYHGRENAHVHNGAAVRGTSLTIRNDYLVTWYRDVVNNDGMAGEFDEDKSITQDFAVRLRLVDGAEVLEGAKLAFTAPATVKTVRSVTPRLDAKVDEKGPALGGSVGFTWGDEKTYTSFAELEREQRERTVSGSATVVRALPCPDEADATVDTWFEGDFAVDDHETFSGSLGARQELTLAVVNSITSVVVDGCLACGAVPPPTTTPPPPVTTPTDPPVPAPPPPPPVTTPTDPLAPAPAPRSADPLAPVLPTGPAVPLGPEVPLGPDGFDGPEGPVDPLHPELPGPVGPLTPCTPWDPWAPDGPDAPDEGPCDPFDPLDPLAFSERIWGSGTADDRSDVEDSVP